MQLFNLTVNGKPVNNQYVLFDKANNRQIFRSYNTNIAVYNMNKNKIIVSDTWKISATTLKYFCRWLEQISGCEKANKAIIEKCLKTGNIEGIKIEVIKTDFAM